MQKMLVGYAKQETIEPLKSLGKYLALGLVGSVMIAIGVVLTGLGVLRFVQTLSFFEGNSWASVLPYLITVGFLIAVIVLIGTAMSRAKRKVR